MFARHLSRKPLACLLASAGLLCTALPAHATLITDSLNAFASAKANGATFMDTPYSETVQVSAVADAQSASGDDTNASGALAMGHANGVYAVSAVGQGVFDSSAAFTRGWHITNDSATAQLYDFNFYIYAGQIEVGTDANNFIGSGSVDYLVNILLGKTSIYSSGVTVNSDGTYATSGSPLTAGMGGTLRAGAQYSWEGTAVTLTLGLLNPGESFDLTYALSSNAAGNFGFSSDCYSNTELDMPLIERCTGTAGSYLGDPSGVDGTPVLTPSITARGANAVPEPGSLALLGLGLAAVAGLRRQRRG